MMRHIQYTCTHCKIDINSKKSNLLIIQMINSYELDWTTTGGDRKYIQDALCVLCPLH